MNLPLKFEDRMKRLLGEEYEEYLTCYLKPHWGGLRVNTLKISPEDFERICPFDIKKIPWTSNGYYYDTKEQPARHPYYYAGLYYIQEPSAMTPASLLPVEPGEKVLDLCAAPGGKSTELGAKLKGEGVLVSNDISNSRAKALLKNIELSGIRNALVVSEEPEKLMDYFPEYFDKILIDAPCSGEGMFRKSASMIKNWEEFGVEYYSNIQKEIIIYAAKMLKPGGMMLYSTCTFSPEENEGTIAFLLEQFPEFHVIEALPEQELREQQGLSYEGFGFGKPEWLEEVDPEIENQLKNCIRLWPHRIDGEGHFITLLQKGEGPSEPEVKVESHPIYEKLPTFVSQTSTKSAKGKQTNKTSNNNKNKKINKANPLASGSDISVEAYDFLDSVKIFTHGRKLEDIGKLQAHGNLPVHENLQVREDRIYMVPECLPDTKGLRILRQGLLLGEMKKQRFEPSQALANALTTEEFGNCMNLSGTSSEAIRYLKCEAIEPGDEGKDGWQLVCVDGFPLGWAKVAKGNLKNKYYPGWRWM